MNPPAAALRRALSALHGLPCLHVAVGRGTGSAFSLHLGPRVLRQVPLPRPTRPAWFRTQEGERVLFVRCAWRVDGPDGPRVGSGDEPTERMATALRRALLGRRVDRARRTGPDLEVTFSPTRPGGEPVRLRLFCDRTAGDDGDAWHVAGPGALVWVGPGGRLGVETGA